MTIVADQPQNLDPAADLTDETPRATIERLMGHDPQRFAPSPAAFVPAAAGIRSTGELDSGDRLPACTMKGEPVSSTQRVDDLGAFRFWTPSQRTRCVWTFVVDIDRADSLDVIASAMVRTGLVPTWIVHNGLKGSSQVGFAAEPIMVYLDRDRAAWIADLQTVLTWAFDGDWAFKHARCRSPLCRDADVIWAHDWDRPHTLASLTEHLKRVGAWETRPPIREHGRVVLDADGRPVPQPVIPDTIPSAWTETPRPRPVVATTGIATEGERAQRLFEALRTAAVTALREGTYSRAVLESTAAAFRMSPRLPEHEIDATIASVARWAEATTVTARTSTGVVSAAWSARQAARGHVGGTAGTDAQDEQRAAALTAEGRAVGAATVHEDALWRQGEAVRMTEAGATASVVAESLGVSVRSVRRYLADARDAALAAEYEALLDAEAATIEAPVAAETTVGAPASTAPHMEETTDHVHDADPEAAAAAPPRGRGARRHPRRLCRTRSGGTRVHGERTRDRDCGARVLGWGVGRRGYRAAHPHRHGGPVDGPVGWWRRRGGMGDPVVRAHDRPRGRGGRHARAHQRPPSPGLAGRLPQLPAGPGRAGPHGPGPRHARRRGRVQLGPVGPGRGADSAPVVPHQL